MATGEQKNWRSGQEDEAGGDHACGHQLGTGAAFHVHAGTQPDLIAVYQFYGIEFQGHLASHSPQPPALNASDAAVGDGSRGNNRETGDVYISYHDKIQVVANPGVGRGNAFGKLKLDGGSIGNGQSGRNRTSFLGRNPRHEKHREQDISGYFAEIRAGQWAPPLLEV